MIGELERAYRGRTVLVTGHTGFKGAWLSAWLTRLGARVVGFALPPEDGPDSLVEAARIGERMVSRTGDVRDPGALAAACAVYRPEIVFHLAAQALVRRAYRDPAGSYATNVMGTVHLLEAVRATPGTRAVVVVTSDKCYQPRTGGGAHREDDPLGGDDPYSSSKGCAELVVAAYRQSFFAARDGRPAGAAVATARAGNVIGGGDWGEDRLLPDLMRAARAGVPAVVRNPSAVRPWQHVLDPLAGYLLLGARLREGGVTWAEAWNFGPPTDEAVTVEELARRVAARWDRVRVEARSDPGAPPETTWLQLDAGKARRRLGWQPRLSTDEAIGWTLDWYRRWLEDPASAPHTVEEQLAAYSARLEGP